MQINYFLSRIFQVLTFTLFFAAVSIGTLAQTSPQPTPEMDDELEARASLQGLTEAILVNGEPALRIVSRKNGSTEVKFQRRDGQDTLVFEVHKLSVGGPEGKLYITKDKVTFDPYEKKSSYFSFSKSEIKEVRLDKEGFAGSGSYWVRIKTSKDEEKVTPLFSGEDIYGGKRFAVPAANFIVKAIQNFDSTLTEFNQLIASVRPKSEDDEEVEEAETEPEISDKYDRFKDVTIVRTSRMLVRGSKRSIRIHAEYNFAGKNQIKAEKVSLYFHASAVRPLFREEDLELNFLADGKRLPLGQIRMAEEEKTKSTVKQTVVIVLPLEAFAQIANAKKVEFQIGTLEYKLTDAHLEAFKKLLAYKVEDAEDK